jgi:Tol biopolymer transport system component
VTGSGGAARVRVTAGATRVWSPDGKRIAFVSQRDNLFGEIYTMNADGTNVVRLTNTPGASDSPSWSKDGSQLVFSSNRDLFDPATGSVSIVQFEVYVMNADGSGVTRLTNNDQFDGEPVFSPDGRHIAFTSQRDHPTASGQDLYLMDADGANVTRLTSQDADLAGPSWDPHGRNLAFSISGSKTENGIYTLDPDNLGLTRLTFGASGVDDARESLPRWSR